MIVSFFRMSPIVKLIWEGNLPKIAMGWQEVETVPTSSPLASGVRDTPSNSVQETSDDLLENFLDSVVETSLKVVVDWTVNVCSAQGVELMLTDTISPLPVPDFALGEMFSGQPASQTQALQMPHARMPGEGGWESGISLQPHQALQKVPFEHHQG